MRSARSLASICLADSLTAYEGTIVFVSHDPDHRDYASDLVYLRDGRLVEPYF